jgi:hypothetical protein
MELIITYLKMYDVGVLEIKKVEGDSIAMRRN